MTCFLISSSVMFGGLLLVFGALRSAEAWARPGLQPLLLAGGATLAIATSSVVLHRGVCAVVRARPAQLPGALTGAIALGLGFILLEVWLWLGLAGPASGVHERHRALLYALTGFHFCHVVVGLGLLAWLVPGARRSRYHGRDHVRVRLVARFWHFLGIQWALLFVFLFLW